MEVTASGRDHLFETISQQYEPDDAETFKAMLTATSTEHLAIRHDIATMRAELTTMRAEMTTLKLELTGEFKDSLYQQTRTYISWMFGLLTVYTAMAGSLIAVAAIIISR
jgi:hypothetical protein